MTIVPFLTAAAASAVAADMMQHTRRQAPARKVLREALKARAKQLRALGVDEETIQQDALRFGQAVHALLPRKRVAGAAEQVVDKIAVRIGERAAAAGPLPAMPKPTPPEPHFRIRFASKIALHPHYRGDGYVARLVDNLMNRSANDAQRCIDGTLAVVRSLVAGLGLDDDASANFLLDLKARIHAAYWRAVLLDPPSPGKHPNDR